MIRIENTVRPSGEQWKAAIMGARNPMNSWDKSDSGYCKGRSERCDDCCINKEDDPCYFANSYKGKFYVIGSKDLDLMKRLCKAGTDHRKFMRMLPVMATITAPLYWWKQFSTYKVGVVENSCSTMHKISDKKFTLDDFSYEHLLHEANCVDKDILDYRGIKETPLGVLYLMISSLNLYRECYIETRDKKYWWQMIQLLPSSYNQKRTVMMNYEVLANIYHSRNGHKLNEWNQFCSWIEKLPYSELIIGDEEKC